MLWRGLWWLLRLGLKLGALALVLALLLVLPWRWLSPPTTSFIAQHDWQGGERLALQWVPLADISRAMPLAVVSAEDQKFPLHHGFDFDQIAAALEQGRDGRPRGASTITQQLAKNLYLWPGRSLLRKGLEAGLTLLIELCWPKRRILEVYLNVVEFGPGVYGVGAASQHFFAKHPRALSMREASLLAAVLPNPKRMSVARPSAYVARRARAIERGVRNLGGESWLPWL